MEEEVNDIFVNSKLINADSKQKNTETQGASIDQENLRTAEAIEAQNAKHATYKPWVMRRNPINGIQYPDKISGMNSSKHAAYLMS